MWEVWELSWFLTQLLARAVPEVYVESTRIEHWDLPKWGVRDYFIVVEPHHRDYWGCFRRKYPHYKRLACARGVEELDLELGRRQCPVFHSKEDLLGWLADTLDLTQGERKLLKILFGYKC